jgi:hydroxymethylbilane synthase
MELSMKDMKALPDRIYIATRRSKLAMIQSGMAQQALQQALITSGATARVELLPLQTTGDALKERNLQEIGGKGVFTKEIEEALLDGRAHIAMHSLKDVPADMPSGLTLACALPREDYGDALIAGRKLASLDELPRGAHIGTSSPRRGAQLLKLRPDLKIIPFRGNVQTRLQKLRDGVVDATILAVAGLKRLNLQEHISLTFNRSQMLPAIGQGIIALQCREDATAICQLLASVNHPPSWHQLLAERAFLEVVEGDCRSPLAGLAEIVEGKLTMEGLIISEDGQSHYRAIQAGPIADAASLGKEVAHELSPHIQAIW